MSKNKEESLQILNNYKNILDNKSFNIIKSTIGSLAIEDMFLTKEDIEESVQVYLGKTTHENIINKHLKEWGVL